MLPVHFDGTVTFIMYNPGAVFILHSVKAEKLHFTYNDNAAIKEKVKNVKASESKQRAEAQWRLL